MFLASYATLIFLFYFFIKPFYIIMVFNWAFDTLHTKKTPSYYLYCLCLFVALVGFFLFNLWQVLVSLQFRGYLSETTRSLSGDSAAPLNPSRHSPSPPSKILNIPPIVHLTNTSRTDVPPPYAIESMGIYSNDSRSRRSSVTENKRFAV
jgi:hypothetical protein